VVVNMRVAFVVELFFPHIGGSERRYEILTEWLSGNGFEVDVHTSRYSTSLPAEERKGAVRIFRHGVGRHYVKGAKRSLYGSFRLAMSSLFVKAAGDYDIYYLSEWPLLHSLLSPIRRAKTVQEWCEVWEGGSVMALERIVAKASDHHVAVSEFTLERTRDLLGIRDVRLIPNPLKLGEMRRYRKPRVEGRIVYVGRLLPHKHVDMLVRCMPKIKMELHSAELHIVGSGPEEERIRDMARVINGVVVHGNLPDPELYELLSTASLFVLASEREGDGISALEAMAFGTPIVTANYPNNAALRFARSGAGLVAEPEVESFASACAKLLADAELWERASRKANELAETRDVDRIGKLLADLFEQVVRG
jgi:glycosyltransferase involved in cell wall biosynthesis